MIPQVTTTTDEHGWRWYNEKYVSVTTVLSNAVANKKLEDWFKRSTVTNINTTRERTAKFGSDAHLYFEMILRGEKFECPPEHRAHVDAFARWAKENNVEPLHIEVPILSDKHGYGGRVDFVGKVNGEIVVADWKTSLRYDIKNGWQLGAYRMALQEMGLIDENAGLLGLQVDRAKAEIKTFKYQHLDFVEHAFLATLDVFRALYYNKLASRQWPWLSAHATTKNITKE